MYATDADPSHGHPQLHAPALALAASCTPPRRQSQSQGQGLSRKRKSGSGVTQRTHAVAPASASTIDAWPRSKRKEGSRPASSSAGFSGRHAAALRGGALAAAAAAFAPHPPSMPSYPGEFAGAAPAPAPAPAACWGIGSEDEAPAPPPRERARAEPDATPAPRPSRRRRTAPPVSILYASCQPDGRIVYLRTSPEKRAAARKARAQPPLLSANPAVQKLLRADAANVRKEGDSYADLDGFVEEDEDEEAVQQALNDPFLEQIRDSLTPAAFAARRAGFLDALNGGSGFPSGVPQSRAHAAQREHAYQINHQRSAQLFPQDEGDAEGEQWPAEDSPRSHAHDDEQPAWAERH